VYARVTQFDIDTVAISIPTALQRFRELILPTVRQQAGYEGVLLLHTEEGRGMIISLWESEESALAGEVSGYYGEQIGKFITFYRQPPGRDHFEVGHLETHATTRS
jgi:heme-degrading monooxygenase HmoA